ncbi:MAG: hypothetical protein IT374_04800 [Polyangiaceae bacterium]|nr:hypothetical protein [Polyangiaceae bacterium]
MDERLARLLPFVPVVVATAWLARVTTRNILAKSGEPAVPLDDAYIHFQYARSLAEGRFFAFQPGEGYTSGATSLLWPALLAPFYAAGLRDTAIIWAAWGLGFAFLGLLAWETTQLTRRLAGDACAYAAGAATLGFGGYTWFAASGMEVTLLAYVLARTARACAEHAEAAPAARTWRRARALLVLSLIGPLVRPEGTLASGLVLLTLALFPPALPGKLPARLLAACALVGPLVPPLINRALTGHFSTTTTQVKWLVGNPYYVGPALVGAVRANIELFFRTLMDGREWSAIFLPAGSQPVMLAALVAIPYAGARSGRGYRALVVCLLAVGMLVPTTYLSFLWNRLRYLWPFAFAWCVGLGCLGRAVGDLLAAFRPRFAQGGSVAAGALAGMLAHHLPWSIDDVSQSSYAIHNQQVLLGRWAREWLPDGARIGLNDTGAIAYFSGKKTFDVVGLTTPEEARYWVAGAGARFEHYERLHRERPERLPTHFIVYPHWMAVDPVLGKELTRATVREQSILGGPTMVAYEARWDRLHTGELPLEPPAGALVDVLDVADLESEVAHAYDLLIGGGTDANCRVATHDDDDGRVRADGGRSGRVRDRFRLKFPDSRATVLVARWSSEEGATVTVDVDGTSIERLSIPPGVWTERRVAVPPRGSPAIVDVTAVDGRFGSLHYWLYAE